MPRSFDLWPPARAKLLARLGFIDVSQSHALSEVAQRSEPFNASIGGNDENALHSHGINAGWHRNRRSRYSDPLRTSETACVLYCRERRHGPRGLQKGIPPACSGFHKSTRRPLS